MMVNTFQTIQKEQPHRSGTIFVNKKNILFYAQHMLEILVKMQFYDLDGYFAHFEA